MNAGRPTGVVTFLFTDIEGSTRRWESDADAMRSALAAHDGVLRDAIETHDGWLFKHTGDGVCAVFASPKAAVDAAIAAQRILELPVRMGIATGEAELRDGDYFGAVLNRASRVMSAGHGGQILLDGTTAGLLHRSRPDNAGKQAITGYRQAGRYFPSSSRGITDRLSAIEDRRCDTGKSAGADDEPDRARDRNCGATKRIETASAGDADWCRRCRQDPLGAGAGRPISE